MAKKSQKRDTIFVVIEGGVVQSVCTKNARKVSRLVDVEIIDYDTEGAADSELSDIVQSDGSVSKARVYSPGLSKLGVSVHD